MKTKTKLTKRLRNLHYFNFKMSCLLIFYFLFFYFIFLLINILKLSSYEMAAFSLLPERSHFLKMYVWSSAYPPPLHRELWVSNKNAVSHSYFREEILYESPPTPTHSGLCIPSGPTHSPLTAILILHFNYFFPCLTFVSKHWIAWRQNLSYHFASLQSSLEPRKKKKKKKEATQLRRERGRKAKKRDRGRV